MIAARLRKVAAADDPSRADSACSRIAMRLESMITLISV